MVILKELFWEKKADFWKKKSANNKKNVQNFPVGKELINWKIFSSNLFPHESNFFSMSYSNKSNA